MAATLLQRLRARPEWKFFAVLPKAHRALAIAWWSVLLLRGVLPALFAIAMGVLVGAVVNSASLTAPLALAGLVFVLLQVLSPLHQAISANLGSQTAAWLYDELATACVRPPGLGHLEDPRLMTDLSMARDFDLGISGPPLSTAMDFTASGLLELVGGLASRCAAGRLHLVGATAAGRRVDQHALAAARKRGVARSQYRRSSLGPAAGRLRVPPGRGSSRREGTAVVRTGGMDGRPLHIRTPAFTRSAMAGHPFARAARAVEPVDRTRRQCHGVLGMAEDAAAGRLALARVVTFASAALSTSMIAFGGLSWVLDGAAAPMVAVLRLKTATGPAGALVRGQPRCGGRTGARDPFSQRPFCLPRGSGTRAGRLRPDDSRWIVARHCRPEWRRQDHAREAIVPAYTTLNKDPSR